MRFTVTGLQLALCLAVLSTEAVLAQSIPNQAITDTSAALVANVYVQTAKGVDVFTATAAGKLTLVKGSPFATVGNMEGVNGKYLISVGNTWLHSYPIQSNGALGKQVATINTGAYGGSQCGQTNGGGSVLDHTGKYLYVSLSLPSEASGDTGCAVLQSYQIESNGQFKYLGYVDSYGAPQGLDAVPDSMPTIGSNNKFAYATHPEFEDGNYNSYAGFEIASNGDLGVIPNFGSQDPQTRDGSWFYYPVGVAADNAGHLAALVDWFVEGGAPQLASYTIESNGSIKSTNTWANMPTVSNYAAISMSWSGKLLAVNQNPGLQIFHFNGSAPITKFSSLLLPTTYLNQMAWDKNNHLYVLAANPQVIYVYTVTPTSISQVPGSPLKVANSPGNMIVVPK